MKKTRHSIKVSSNFFVACQTIQSLNDDATTILSGPIKIMQTNLAEVQEELTKFG